MLQEERMNTFISKREPSRRSRCVAIAVAAPIALQSSPHCRHLHPTNIPICAHQQQPSISLLSHFG
ncbi:conserved hypothetical protein [Ricinus communis]|uniref:Uncharacterized protein n=1 Tax=Ricinus communis TaxID=3988 RepID=B9S946_RICCO|nr:conserved hypothetical protein [Ricinus communis]